MSSPSLRPVLIAVFALLVGLPLAAQQQDSGSTQQPPAAAQKNTEQKDQKKQDKNQKAGQQDSTAPPAQQQNPPSAPAPQQSRPGSSTADQNPFPEAESEKAAKEAQARRGNQDSSSSVVPGLKLPENAGKQPPRLAPKLDPSLGRQDTKVGDFYLQSGDWKGAYSRFLEATQVDPGDAEAVYGLAAAARHLGDRKTAIQNYQLYLAALPRGPRARDCRKALKEMGAHP